MLGGIKTGGTEVGVEAGAGDGVVGWEVGVQDMNVE